MQVGLGLWTPAYEPGVGGPPGTSGTDGEDSVQVQIQVINGSQAMRGNVGSVTWKAVLMVGQVTSSDLGQVGSNINSYNWYLTATGGSRTLVTNGNIESLTGSISNNNNRGSGDTDPFPHYAITIEADGTVLGISSSGSAGIECEIDYTI